MLDLELVLKENRLDIGKCNGRIPHGLTPREPTFQVVLDAIALTPCYPVFFITADVPEIFPRVPARDFNSLPSEEDIVSFLRELGHTGEISLLNDVVVDQMHQPWRSFAALINRDYVELLWEDFIYQIENRVYKKQEKMYYPRFTKAVIRRFLIQDKILSWRKKIRMHTSKDDYLISTLRFVSAKESTQIYGAILPKCLTNLSTKKSKAYKTYLGYATCDVPPKIVRKFKKASPSKKDSDLVHVDEEPITKGKRVKRSVKKSSTKPATDDSNDDNDSENEGNDEEKESDDDKTPSCSEKGSDSEQDTDESESYSESDQQDYDEEVKDDDDEVKDDDEYDDDDDDDDDDDRSEENLKITQEQVVEDAHVMITTVAKESEVPDASISHSSDLASRFLNFSDIHPNDAEIVSLLDVHIHHEVPRIHTSTLLTVPVLGIPEASPVCTTIPQSSQTFTSPLLQTTPTPLTKIKTTNIPSTILDFTSVFRFNDRVIALEQDVAELKKDPLHTQVTALVDDHPDTRMGATREEFMNFLSVSLTDRITEQVSSQPQSTYEAAATLTEFELKKILINKINISESYMTAPEHQECYDSLLKPYNLDKDFFSSYDVYSLKRSRQDKDKDEGPSARSDRGFKKRKTSKDAEPTTGSKNKDSTSGSSKGTKYQPKSSGKTVQSEEPEFKVGDTNTPQECYKALLEKLDWENPKCGDYPFDLSKPLPLITRGNHQSVPVKFFINNDLKYLQGRISTMTYPTSTTKIKAAQYDLPGISYWREQCKSFYAYARGKQSRGDVYSIKHILAVTHVSVMRKHGYGYLEEIVVRRADNVLYKFKEGDDVADLTIALRMPDTTRQELRKRHPYTPCKDPQGFIYVDDYKRNRHYQEYRHGVLVEEKMEHIGKEKSSFYDQGHQQAAKGKEDDEEFREICWW
nr:hypothetical protein [Tanacetum cinerariifolium]